MAMGAFIAGVLLSESSFRHQLEADIEPFRGLLSAFSSSASAWRSTGADRPRLAAGHAAWLAFMALKVAGIYAVARLFRVGHADSVRVALLLAQGGEFAFVLFTTAPSVALLDARNRALLTAAVILSMALTPLAPILLKRSCRPTAVHGRRRGGRRAERQRAGHRLRPLRPGGEPGALSRGIDVSIIDFDTEMIRAAARFGFKIYYGDGTRLDVLRAAGAGSAKIVAVCIDRRDGADRIVELVKAEFPLAKLLVRAFDRGHSLDLVAPASITRSARPSNRRWSSARRRWSPSASRRKRRRTNIAGVRKRDAERLKLQIVEGFTAGRDSHEQQPTPTPLTKPKARGTPLNEETAAIARRRRREAGRPRTAAAATEPPRRLRDRAGSSPAAVAGPAEHNAVVEAEGAVLPELDLDRGQAEARPVSRARDVTIGIFPV